MDFLKKVNALVLGVAVLLAFGCGGDEPEPVDPGEVSVECKLTRRTNNINIYYYDFQYDHAGKLIRIDRINPANSSWNTFQTLEYNSSGKVSKVNYFKSSPTQPVGTILFGYNAAGLLSQRSYDSAGQDPGYVFEKYAYNAAGQLIKKEEFNPTELYAYSTYTTLPGNKIKEENFGMNNGIAYGGGFTEWSFSNKKHPLGRLGYIDNEIYFYAHMSENEIIGFAPGGQASQGFVTSYQYDANGYITKEISVPGSGNTLETQYSYICQ